MQFVKRQTPSTMRPTNKDKPKGPPKSVRVRVYGDQEHRSYSRRWRDLFTEQLDLANQILVPEFGIRLEVAEFKEWKRRAHNDKLGHMLDEIEALDPAADVDLVIGLTSALSFVSPSFHELGVARPMGRHMIVRGFSDVAERKVFAERYDRLSKAELEEVLRARRQHKQAVVLLHEWGHTMGAIHVKSDVNTVMMGTYNIETTGFSRANAGLLRAVLDAKLVDADERSQVAEMSALRAYLDDKGTWAGWDADDYAHTRSILDQFAQAQRERPVPAGQGTKSGIPAEAKQMFLRVGHLARNHQLDDAIQALQPLLDAYPANLEFRVASCRLWLEKDGLADTAISQCRRIGELDPGETQGDAILAQAYVAAGDLAGAHGVVQALIARAEAMTGNQSPMWEAVLGFYRGMNAVTWAEQAAARAPSSVDTGDTRAWALGLRRRYGLPPAARRFGITPALEGEYLALVRNALNLVYAQKYDEARKLVNQGKRRFRNAPGLLGVLCDLEVRKRRFTAARSLCQRAVKGYPEISWARYLLGIVELRYRRNRAGIDHLEQAIEYDPELRQAYHALYKAYARKGDRAAQARLSDAYSKRFGVPIPQ